MKKVVQFNNFTAKSNSEDTMNKFFDTEECQHMVMQLREAHEALPLEQPSDQAWLKIKGQLPKTAQPKRSFWTTLMPLAASLLIVFTTINVVQEKHNEQLLSSQLERGQELSKQLKHAENAGYFQGEISWELSKLDEQISFAQTFETKHELLTKRNEVLEKWLRISSKQIELI